MSDRGSGCGEGGTFRINLVKKAMYEILIYLWCTVQCQYHNQSGQGVRYSERREKYEIQAARTRETRSKAYKIRRPFHYLQIRTNLPLTVPSLLSLPFLHPVRPIRLYITQNLIPEQTRRKFRIIPAKTFPSGGRHHPHLHVSLLLLRSIV